MNNVFSYLFWRGDLTLDIDEFNNIDALVLARLSYIPFENIVSKDFNESITIKEAYDKSFAVKDFEKGFILENDKPFFKAVAKSERFQNMTLSAYVNEIDKKSEKQFSAITIDTNDGFYFVAYRGTDNTLVGWKEDFNMSFLDIIPAQEEAKEYLEYIRKDAKLPLTVAGHSKGGNLAVYASSFCNEETQYVITKVYNFDGPGLNQNLIKKKDIRIY